ncbi:uncharacterized protein LOC123718762 isoform X1 [Pieris brassicae]|uniref:uncharacterized protein LOC123718762 isoform X1 n=1 Tax=Pieris brassicae TaxID=7116 RepID=UPI001E661491|nr:uncharacterized protein LOC123718762 isoform X1 [Pieris brassicae]
MGRSGTKLAPKHAGKSSKSTIPSSKPKTTSSKLPAITPSTSSKALLPPYTPGKNKSSTSFGVIWLPISKRSKHKDYVYNAYKPNDQNKERAPSMYNMMSGDSSNHHTLPKMDEESVKDKEPVVLGGVATAAALDREFTETDDNLEKPFTDDKDAAGDANSTRDNDLLTEEKSKGSVNDNVDSVFLRPPPAGKVRSTPSTQEEDSCGIKCLYYTLQCCDCVLM